MQKVISCFIINWIIFFFQFESLGFGALSVVRIFIFPFLLLYLCLEQKIIIYKSLSLLICLVICMFESLSGIYNGEIPFIVSGIINSLTIVVFFDYLVKNNGFTSTNMLVFATYDLMSIFCFLMTSGVISLSNRFQGIYWDPNVLCVYILISFCAKVVWISNKKMSLWIYACFGVLFFLDMCLILASVSRAGLLTLGLVILLAVFLYSKLLFTLLVSSLSLLLGYMFYIALNLTWSLDLNPIEILSYRLFVSSAVELETGGDGSRSDRLDSFFNLMSQGDIPIIGNGTNYLPNGDYLHNGICEFILAVGLPLGMIFILLFAYLLFRNIVWNFIRNKGETIQIFVLAYFVVTVFYSYLSFKSFWVFIAYLLYLNIKTRKRAKIVFFLTAYS